MLFCHVCAAIQLNREDTLLSILPRPILVVCVEVIQHVCFSGTGSEATGVPELGVGEQGLGDANVAFTCSQQEHK